MHCRAFRLEYVVTQSHFIHSIQLLTVSMTVSIAASLTVSFRFNFKPQINNKQSPHKNTKRELWTTNGTVESSFSGYFVVIIKITIIIDTVERIPVALCVPLKLFWLLNHTLSMHHGEKSGTSSVDALWPYTYTCTYIIPGYVKTIIIQINCKLRSWALRIIRNMCSERILNEFDSLFSIPITSRIVFSALTVKSVQEINFF